MIGLMVAATNACLDKWRENIRTSGTHWQFELHQEMSGLSLEMISTSTMSLLMLSLKDSYSNSYTVGSMTRRAGHGFS